MDKFFSPCPRGLEALLADDIKDYGGRKVDIVPGGVAFEGTWETCYRANLESRIATRILWRLGSAPYRSEAEIYRLAYDMPWTHLFSPDQTLRVYVTAQRSHLKSLEYITLKVKDAICDRFRADGGSRPSIDTKNPDVRIHLFLTDRDATLYVDTSGEPLYQRGHKIAKVEAPLKENLAAGILRLAGWKPGIPLFDPMCGSGTFLLEAVQMSLGDAPGLARDAGGFGFQRLKNFDGALWKRLRIEAAEQRISIGELPIWGSDISSDAVARARQNLAHAGYDDLVRLGQADLLNVSPPVPEGILVANPPYGERLSDDDALAEFYPQLGDALKRRFSGWNCWFLTADPRLAKLIGLRPKRKTPIFNGNLECRLYSFPMVSGTAREL